MPGARFFFYSMSSRSSPYSSECLEGKFSEVGGIMSDLTSHGFVSVGTELFTRSLGTCTLLG
jgi:hypothetical protein